MKLYTLLLVLLLLAKSSFNQTLNTTGDPIDKSLNKYLTPAHSLENPVGGGSLGFMSLALSLQNKTRLGDDVDGSAAAYIGLGEPQRFIGAGATINIYGLSNDVGESNNLAAGGVNFHVNKFLFANKMLLDAGVENAFLWGKKDIDTSYISYQRSYYFSANYLFNLSRRSSHAPFSFLSVTIGAGSGYFRTDSNYTIKGADGFDPFCSVATPVSKSTNLIMEWNGYDIGTGFSSIPFRKLPLMLTIEATDLVFGKPRINLTITSPINFFRIDRKSKRNNLLDLRTTRPLRPVRTL